MTHLELENLSSDYLEGQLDKSRQAEVEEHLAGCSSCQEVLSDVRFAIQTCRSAGEVMPPPWLVSRIRLTTMGEARTGIAEQVNAMLRSIRQPRVAYAVAMTVFSVSLIVNVAGLNLRSLNMGDLNPATWVYRANRAGHLLYARAEKFYDDLRIVYEIESRFRNAQSDTDSHEEQTRKPGPSKGRPASTVDLGGEQMASAKVNATGQYAQLEPGVQTHEMR
jgi:Putative zinc-finger